MERNKIACDINGYRQGCLRLDAKGIWMGSKKLFGAWDPENAVYASLDDPEWTRGKKLPNGFWHDLENHKRYWKWLTKKLRIKNLDDWYSVSTCVFRETGGNGLLQTYSKKIDAFEKQFPKKNWLPWKFSAVPANFWESDENIHAYMKWLTKELKIKKLDDWYNFKIEDFYQNYGRGLVYRFNCSIYHFLCYVYPDHEWLAWRFTLVPRKFWDNQDNRVSYLKWLEGKLKIKQPQEWYQVSSSAFSKNYGHVLLVVHFRYDLCRLVKELYPEEPWLAWRFRVRNRDYWDSKPNCFKYILWLAKKLGVRKKEDWYQVSRGEIMENDGKLFLRRYKSIGEALRVFYPEYSWLPWKFQRIPFGFWEKPKNRKWYLSWLGIQLQFKTKKDWDNLNYRDVVRHHGLSIVWYFGLEQTKKEGKFTAGKKMPTKWCC